MFNDLEEIKIKILSTTKYGDLIHLNDDIFNFKEKFNLKDTSPEIVFLRRMIKLMKLKLKNKKNEEYNIIELIKEEIGDFEWLRDNEKNIKSIIDFNLKNKEYWVDISFLNHEQKIELLKHLFKSIPNYSLWMDNPNEVLNVIKNYDAVVVNCGTEETDYKPKEGLICLLKGNSYNDDLDAYGSIYVDGLDIITNIKKEELGESLGWDSEDSDTNFGKDNNFTPDNNWSVDISSEINKEKSYWIYKNPTSSSE